MLICFPITVSILCVNVSIHEVVLLKCIQLIRATKDPKILWF